MFCIFSAQHLTARIARNMTKKWDPEFFLQQEHWAYCVEIATRLHFMAFAPQLYSYARRSLARCWHHFSSTFWRKHRLLAVRLTDAVYLLHITMQCALQLSSCESHTHLVQNSCTIFFIVSGGTAEVKVTKRMLFKTYQTQIFACKIK